MKPTFLLLVALAITPPLMAVEKSKKAAHHPKKNTEMKAEADAIDFKVTGAGGAVKSYHLEVPQTAGKNRPRPWLPLIGHRLFMVPQL